MSYIIVGWIFILLALGSFSLTTYSFYNLWKMNKLKRAMNLKNLILITAWILIFLGGWSLKNHSAQSIPFLSYGLGGIALISLIRILKGLFALANWNKEKELIELKGEENIDEMRDLLRKAVLVQFFIFVIFLASIFFLKQWLALQVL